MIGDVGVRTSIPLTELTNDCITPQFVFGLLENAHDPETAGFIDALTTQAVGGPLSLIKTFLGEDHDLSGGTIGMPVSQPKYVHVLCDTLRGHLFHNASICTIGLPGRLQINAEWHNFDEDSWWIRDAPSLPLNDATLTKRNFAWILYHFAEYS